ncbi:hypothetical protein CPC08DRAFT_713795 [Agrocybe pediades]|nr:hypothetical protein CPC08DRAFT_713795 [Agrocybe pediades]
MVRTKCRDCENCDAIHTAVLNDSISQCPPGIQKCAQCRNVDRLTSEVEETIERLEKLLKDLRQAKTDMNRSHDMISRTLPPEILQSIFELYALDPALPQDGCDTFDERYRRKKMARPVVLSQVCSNWRQVALATPRIWTTVVVTWDVEFWGAEEEIDRLREWISRTRGFPLDIYMDTTSWRRRSADDDDPPFDSLDSSFCPFLQAIASTSAQWRYLTARAPYCALEYLGQHVQHLDLEGLNISRVWSSGRKITPHPFWTHCQPAPKSVELIDCLPNKVNIQWNAVTTIKVTEIYTEQCLSLLSSTPNLTTCIFEKIRPEDREELSWHINRPVVKHEKIQKFTYSSSFFYSCPFIFYRLELPNLRSFTCKARDLSEIRGHDIFFSSVSNLNVLSVRDISCNYDTLHTILSKAPGTVTDLILSCRYHAHSEFAILRLFSETAVIDSNGTPNAGTDVLILPNLNMLEIRTKTEKFPWKLVLKCFGVTPRRRPLSRLRVIDRSDTMSGFFEKDGGVLIPPDVLKELMALQRYDGVEIVFRHKSGYDLLARSIVDAGLEQDRASDYSPDQ